MERETFAPAGEALRGKEEFALAIDQVRQWIASGEVMAAPDGQTGATELYRAYVGWADRSGQGRLRETEFSNRLESIGYPRERVGGHMLHKGLRPQGLEAQASASAGFF